MAPLVDKAAAKFDTAIVTEKVNLAIEPDRAARLGVMATPTLIGFTGGELVRLTGRRTPAEVDEFFSAVAEGRSDVAAGKSDRVLRVTAGIALVVTGLAMAPAWPLVGAGVAITGWGWWSGRSLP